MFFIKENFWTIVAGMLVGLLAVSILDYYSTKITGLMYVAFPLAGAVLVLAFEYVYTFYYVFLKRDKD